jgi:pseudouridine synthase
MEKIRIQKVLAQAGLASRRSVEEMVLQGRITVNGLLVTSLPCFVEAGDQVLVDGQPVRKRPQEKTYILLNKPRGAVCTSRDEPGFDRPTAVGLIPDMGQRIYCVGRLDEDSTGLIILTNDGELTNRLTHPSRGITKTYIVRVEGRPDRSDLESLRRGMVLDGARTGPTTVDVLDDSSHTETLLQMRLAEGRNRQIRRMLARLEHEVTRLHLSAIGPISDRGLKIGHWRYLSSKEVESLMRIAGLSAEGAPRDESQPAAPRRKPRVGFVEKSRRSTHPPRRPAGPAGPAGPTGSRRSQDKGKLRRRRRP